MVADPDDVIWAEDVVSVARELGLPVPPEAWEIYRGHVLKWGSTDGV